MWRYLGTGLLALLVVGSCLAVILLQHQQRDLFVELRELERLRDRLEIDWDRLRLERSALTSNDQVVDVARNKLGLSVPEARAIVLVTP